MKTSSSPLGTVPEGWGVVHLRDISSKVGSGATPLGGASVYLSKRTNYALIRSQNVLDRSFDPSDLAFIDDAAAARLASVEVKPGDLLLNITGDGKTFSRSCLVPPSVLPACVNQHVSIIRVDPSQCHPGFLLSYLTHPSTKKYIESFNTGASRRAVTKAAIESFLVPLPPPPIQDTIASILSAYDDLIENNNRRIKILEEMAQALYREWFVNFRFPGHEKAKMVDSTLGKVPEGWEVSRIGRIARVNPDTLKPSHAPSEIVYIDIASVSTGSIDEVTPMPFATAPSRARRLVKDGDIIWSTVRPNRKSYSPILDPVPNTVVSTGFAVLRADAVPAAYLYFHVTSDAFVSYLVNHAKGAAYPAVASEDFEKANAVIPPIKLLTRFDEIVRPMQRLRGRLQAKNAVLRKTRDLLLPKLISGELDVSAME
jgi:type I restriction enzyme S subunit